MAYYTGNNEFLKQVIPIFNSVDPTGGDNTVADLQNAVTNITTMIDTTFHTIKANSIATYDSGNIVFTSPVEFQGEVTGISSNFSGLSLSTNAIYLSTGVASFFVNGVAGGEGSPAITMGPIGESAIEINQGASTFVKYLSTGNVHVGGNVVASGNITCQTLFQTSDKRLKQDITPILQPLSTLRGIHGVHFTWTNNGMEDIGFLAQDLYGTFPIAVAKPDAMADRSDSTDDYWRVSYVKVVPLLVEAIKKLEDRVQELEGHMDVVYRFNRLSKG